MNSTPVTNLFWRIEFDRKWLLLSAALFLLAACATRPYQYDGALSSSVRDRAITESAGLVSVSASVPGEDETTSIFGVPMYERGIQPVWIEVVNNSDEFLRFAVSSIDPEYFSPLEVAYMYKKGFSKEARAEMEQQFYNSAMPRLVPAGETRSGYVFTHSRPGTKSFNVDLYGNSGDYSFAFFVTVPGFVPDHQAVNFKDLYTADELKDYNLEGFRAALDEQQWFTTSETGEPGLPVSIVIVADGLSVLKALLRAGWYEQPDTRDQLDTQTAHYMFGRLPDASFRINRGDKSERNELYLWQTPMRVDGEVVWMGRIAHFIGQKNQIRQVLFGAQIDPNVDEGRDYFMQNMWYSQNLEQLAWLQMSDTVPIAEPASDFNNSPYFTDGYLAVIWLSGEPVSLVETLRVDWDSQPHKR